MSIELIAVIITGVVSGVDLVVNIATLCCTGRCRSDCCCAHFEHDETPHSSCNHDETNREDQ